MSTNYRNAFIAVAPDCPATFPQEPPLNPKKPSVAALHYALLSEHPYAFTSDELLFAVYVKKNAVADADLAAARDAFFAKSQACFRASPLSKRYGWGTHHDDQGRVALVGIGSADYVRFAEDPTLEQRAAMRSKRA